MKRMERRTNGSAMIAAIVLLAIGMTGLFALFKSTNVFQQFSGFFRKKTALVLAAETGFALARGDLAERADDSFVLVLNPDGSSVNTTDVGLVFTRSGRTVRPRYDIEQSHIQIRVYYFPQDPGPTADLAQWDLIWPKYFHVISEATHTNTGEIHTLEAMIQLRPESLAELSFGMLNPSLLPGMSSFSFVPSTYEGHVHFGRFPGDKAANFNGWGPDSPHTFRGPVTFEDKPKIGRPYPFTYSKDKTGNSYAQLDFQKGYVDGYAIQPDSALVFDDFAGADPPAPVINLKTAEPGVTDVCLKFQQNSTTGRGEIWRYDCDVQKYSAFQRYVGEANGSGGAKLFDETEYSGRVILCDDATVECTIHIKGILKGSVTVAATNISLEGDVVYSDQTAGSDRLGALAKHDLIVPVGVPYGVSFGDPNEPKGYTTSWEMDNYAPEKSKFTGITNFIISEDRDKGDSEYHLPWQNPYKRVNGEVNDVSTLDLDGSYVALGEKQADGTFIGGLLRLEGLNNFDVSPANGGTIPGQDANGNYRLYSADVDQPNSFYFTDLADGLVKRKVEPVFCRWRSDGTCPTIQEQEAAKIWSPAELWRPSSIALWVFGGLITNGYSYLWRTNYYGGFGFQRRVYHEDPGMRVEPPPGFPTTGQIVRDVLWIKNYRGRSTKLADYLGG